MTFKTYTGWQWLLIDAANHFGKDKDIFEDRIKWAMQNLSTLEVLAGNADNQPLYIKAVMAIRKAQAGIATGHMVGVDAICSGIQIMSVLTGCVAGARATGLIDDNVRADAYTSVTKEMTNILGNVVNVSRDDAKKATMTSFYGSKEQPKAIFGENTPELNAFYEAATRVAPGAWELLQDLLGSWRPYALEHSWKLPDGFDARVKVMTKKEVRIEVDELNHASFSYEFYENQGQKKGLSNVANVTHSVDGYVLREMHRRCNYDNDMMWNAADLLQDEITRREHGGIYDFTCNDAKLIYYRDQYTRSGLASAVILPHLSKENIGALTIEHLEALRRIVDGMRGRKPFPLVTVHDEFKAHANNINQVRWHYKEILADIAESNVLDDIMSQLIGEPVTFNKFSFNLGAQIRESNYGLC